MNKHDISAYRSYTLEFAWTTMGANAKMLVRPPSTFYYRKSAAALPHKVGANLPNGSRIYTGQSGFLSYGPYLNLEAGSYFAGFEFEKLASFPDGSIVKLDVVTESGTVFLAERTIDERDLVTGIPSLLTVCFRLEDTTSPVEVRVYCAGQPNLKIKSLVIFPTSAEAEAPFPTTKPLGARSTLWRSVRNRFVRRRPDFATFWNGPLDPLTFTCLATFPHYDLRLRLYSYEPNLAVPKGVELADARAICPDTTLVERYLAEGRVSYAKFSNLFRYELIRQTGLCWVDSDVICHRKPDFSGDAFVFGRQLEPSHTSSIASGVLKLPQDHPIIGDLIREARAVVDIDQSWGVIGPTLLTERIRHYGLEHHTKEISHFYPVCFPYFWKLLLPDYRRAVEKAAEGATFLHLWHEFFRRCGYDKTICPPVGSFFYDLSRRVGTLDRFTRVYDAEELRGALSGWIHDDADREVGAHV